MEGDRAKPKLVGEGLALVLRHVIICAAAVISQHTDPAFDIARDFLHLSCAFFKWLIAEADRDRLAIIREEVQECVCPSDHHQIGLCTQSSCDELRKVNVPAFVLLIELVGFYSSS